MKSKEELEREEEEGFKEAMQKYDANRDDPELWKPDWIFGAVPIEAPRLRQLTKEEFKRRAASLLPGITESQLAELTQLANDFITIPAIAEYRERIFDNLCYTIWKHAVCDGTGDVDAYSTYEFMTAVIAGIRFCGRVPLSDFELPSKSHHPTDYERYIIQENFLGISGNLFAKMLERSTATTSKIIKQLKEENDQAVRISEARKRAESVPQEKD